MDFNTTGNVQGTEFYAPLQRLYMTCLSMPEEDEFDFKEIYDSIQLCIDSTLTQKDRLVDSEVLLNDTDRLNRLFVKTLKIITTELHQKNIALIFLIFCDYFDINHTLAFQQFHEKIQRHIRKGSIEIVGKDLFENIQSRNRREQAKTDGYVIKSIFDLKG